MAASWKMPETQFESYKKLWPTIGRKQREVLSVIQRSPCGLALFEISESLGWPLHCVSGRVTELKDVGLVQDSGKREYNRKTDRYATVWSIVPKQLEMFGNALSES